MAKRELDYPETGTGDRTANEPIVDTATSTSRTMGTERSELFQLVEARWPVFEQLATELNDRKTKTIFGELWKELGSNIVDQALTNLRGSEGDQTKIS